MIVTVSELRANIYKTLDRVLASGIPLEINRRGKILTLVPPSGKSKLNNILKKHGVFNGNPESIVHVDWSKEWKG